MAVGMVIVSHSEKIAHGVVDLAGQMAADVTLVAAGGTDEGGIGTSFDKITAALAEADDGDGVIVLCDLGSAILTAETAIEFLDDDQRDRVRIVDAPLVEGAVAAAVSAQIGGGMDDVAEAARSAYSPRPEASAGDAAEDAPGGVIDDGGAAPRDDAPPAVAATATLVNASGLHARPAADFVRLAGTFDAAVTVNGVDARSLLRIMSLGLGVGTSVAIEATGPQASEAVDALVALIDSGFGE